MVTFIWIKIWKGRERFVTKSCRNVGNHRPVRRTRLTVWCGLPKWVSGFKTSVAWEENRCDGVVYIILFIKWHRFSFRNMPSPSSGSYSTTPWKILTDSGEKLSCRALSKLHSVSLLLSWLSYSSTLDTSKEAVFSFETSGCPQTTWC
jgi:hypothetical protein